ncbi:uncharacterized protein LOC130912259 [Corythoichthys intestinalis]|uniref:uncharacterized protein LOC130912259 n=1 Tax=Corythoichthys intestinalis TaxID=161448 RepID=UPI0025A5C087|nr:uncharacterized protein LOC130912259 [Corythoichthys intestinalis]
MKTAQFSSLKALASWENYMSVKAGYKLTQKVLTPSSIEKQSVRLIMVVINPSTVAGLRLLAMGKEEHRDKADVLKMFQRMISVMNVRGPGQDVRWNDNYRCVLRPRAVGDEGGKGGVEDQAGCFDEQSEANIQFLQQIGEICKILAKKEKKKKRWTKTGRLPTPTASALHITCNTLPASCRDIILRKIPGVKYVCMGKANSDPKEHSFGRRRQM